MKVLISFVAATVLLPIVALAEDVSKTESPIASDLSVAEQEFIDLLTRATLVGKFSFELQPDAIPKTERYFIDSLRKVKGDQWLIQSRMRIGQNELPIPVPVHVQWAGDTPMMQLTDLNIPLVGDGFTARILFYGNRYAGTWQHGKVGGHMWGTVEHLPETSDDTKNARPGVPVQNDGPLK